MHITNVSLYADRLQMAIDTEVKASSHIIKLDWWLIFFCRGRLNGIVDWRWSDILTLHIDSVTAYSHLLSSIYPCRPRARTWYHVTETTRGGPVRSNRRHPPRAAEKMLLVLRVNWPPTNPETISWKSVILRRAVDTPRGPLIGTVSVGGGTRWRRQNEWTKVRTIRRANDHVTYSQPQYTVAVEVPVHNAAFTNVHRGGGLYLNTVSHPTCRRVGYNT